MATLAEAGFDGGTLGNNPSDEGGWVMSGTAAYDAIGAVGQGVKTTSAATWFARYAFAGGTTSPFRLRMYLRKGAQALTNHPIFVTLEDVAQARIADFQIRNNATGRYRLRWDFATIADATVGPTIETWTRIDLLYRGPSLADGWEAQVFTEGDDTAVDYTLTVASGVETIYSVAVGMYGNADIDYWHDGFLLTDSLDDPGPLTGGGSGGLYVGGSAATAVYVGSTPATRVYVGATQVWEP